MDGSQDHGRMILMLYGVACHALSRDDAMAVVQRVWNRPDGPFITSASQAMEAFDEELVAWRLQ